MAFINGPIYPGPSEGLVWAFDPANPKCYGGGDNFTNFSPDSSNLVSIGMGSDEVANVSSGYLVLDGTDTRITGSVASLYNGDRSFSMWFKSPNWKDLPTDTIFAIGGYSVAQPSWNPINFVQIYNEDGNDQWNRIRMGGVFSGTTNLFTNYWGLYLLFKCRSNWKIKCNSNKTRYCRVLSRKCLFRISS